MWRESQNTWDDKALMLLLALQMYEDSLCKGCGQSTLHSMNVANTREFTVDNGVCLGCNVRETWEDQHGDDKTKGRKVYVVNTMGLDGDLDG